MNNSVVSGDISSLHLSQMRPTDSGLTSSSLPTKSMNINEVTQGAEGKLSFDAHRGEV